MKLSTIFLSGTSLLLLMSCSTAQQPPEKQDDLGWSYTKDSQYVYCNGEILEDADPLTFESFSTPSFWRDSSGVYDMFCRKLPGLDPQTTEYFVPDTYLKDAMGIYAVDEKRHVREEEIPCFTIHPDDRTKFPNCNPIPPSPILLN